MTCVAIAHTDPSPTAMSVLYLAGEVDGASAPRVRELLACAGADRPGDVVVDLSKVTFMSCSGLHPLLEAQSRLGDRLWLRRIPWPVTRLLDLTHQRSAFQVIDGGTSGGVEPDRTVRIEQRAADMHQATRRRAVIEEATGLLMGIHGCNAAHAHALMVQASLDHVVPFGDLAVAVTETAAETTRDIPASLATRAALQAVLSLEQWQRCSL